MLEHWIPKYLCRRVRFVQLQEQEIFCCHAWCALDAPKGRKRYPWRASSVVQILLMFVVVAYKACCLNSNMYLLHPISFYRVQSRLDVILLGNTQVQHHSLRWCCFVAVLCYYVSCFNIFNVWMKCVCLKCEYPSTPKEHSLSAAPFHRKDSYGKS